MSYYSVLIRRTLTLYSTDMHSVRKIIENIVWLCGSLLIIPPGAVKGKRESAHLGVQAVLITEENKKINVLQNK